MRPKKITVAEVEYTAFTLAKKLMTWDEPIPDFGTRFPNILESCLQTPFASYGRKDLYRGLVSKASILFYLMIKNHPFQNGKWLTIDNLNLYHFAKGIAASRASSREKTMLEVRATIKKYLTNSLPA